jgi:hypothetical protein
MPNPTPAYPNTECSECCDEIPVGEDVFFHEKEKYCIGCAEELDMVCACGNYKKPEYEYCFICVESKQLN